MKTAVILILAIVAQAIGNVYLTRGMKALNATGDSTLPRMFVEGLASPMLWLGTALLIVFFVLYSAALSWADLSFVLPATAFGYVLNVAAGHYFLNELVTPERWAGAAVITLGVVFVSRSGDRTTGAGGRQVGAAGGGE
jgi:drug/metabolite transporter (DMT)-like permease